MKKNLITRAQTEVHPLIEGNRVTFLWQGDSAPHLIDDLHGWDEHPQKLKLASVTRSTRIVFGMELKTTTISSTCP